MTRALACAALLAGAACARIPFVEPQPVPTAEEGAWGDARARFTRAGKIYDGFGTNAFVTAVYQAPEVREARVDRLAAWRKLTAQERDAMLAGERDEASRWDDFLVTLFTPDRADNDLDTRRSIWRVAVVSGGGELLPEKIELVRPDATLRALYPNVGDFDLVYRVRFPRSKEALAASAFTFRLAGSRGSVDLVYAPGVSDRVRAPSGPGPSP